MKKSVSERWKTRRIAGRGRGLWGDDCQRGGEATGVSGVWKQAREFSGSPDTGSPVEECERRNHGGLDVLRPAEAGGLVEAIVGGGAVGALLTVVVVGRIDARERGGRIRGC